MGVTIYFKTDPCPTCGLCSESGIDIGATYNYSDLIKEYENKGILPLSVKQDAFFGDAGMLGFLDNHLAKEVSPILEKAISQLNGEKDQDHYKPTEGNVKSLLMKILEICKENPEYRITTWR